MPPVARVFVLSVLLVVLGAAGQADGDRVPWMRSEVVLLRVARGCLEVTGRYSFDGNGTRSNLSVLYPIPESGALGAPRVLRARIRCAGSKAHDLRVMATDLGATWELPFRDTNRCDVTIRYRQELNGSKAEYTLQTARGWAEPMQRARLLIFLPHGFSLKRASYPFGILWRDRSGTMYIHEETGFVPENDLIVEWAPR